MLDGWFEVLRGNNPQIGGSATDLYVFYNAAIVPEPSACALALLGIAGLGLIAWRRKMGPFSTLRFIMATKQWQRNKDLRPCGT